MLASFGQNSEVTPCPYLLNSGPETGAAEMRRTDRFWLHLKLRAQLRTLPALKCLSGFDCTASGNGQRVHEQMCAPRETMDLNLFPVGIVHREATNWLSS